MAPSKKTSAKKPSSKKPSSKKPPFRLLIRPPTLNDTSDTASSSSSASRTSSKKTNPPKSNSNLQDKDTNESETKSKTQTWRDKKKAKSKEEYAEILESGRNASQMYRLNMALSEKKLKKRNLSQKEREEAEKWFERKTVSNEKSRIRQRRYQAKKKLEKEKNKDKPQKPLTRKKADKKRETERVKKQNQRATYSKEKLDDINATRRQKYQEKKERERNAIHEEQLRKLQEEEQELREREERLKEREEALKNQQEELQNRNERLPPSDEIDMRSDTAKRQSLCRAKSKLPRHKRSHLAGTVKDLVVTSTPRTSRALQMAGVTVKKSKRRLTLDEALTNELEHALTNEVVDESVGDATCPPDTPGQQAMQNTESEGDVHTVQQLHVEGEGQVVEEIGEERPGVEQLVENNDPLIDNTDRSSSSVSKKQKRTFLASNLAKLKKYKLQREACRRFKISRNLLKSNKKRQGRKKVSLSTVKQVKNFYEVNSNQLPDKRFVSKKTGKARHVMDRSIATLHAQYTQAHPDKPVSASVFYSLRPKHVHTKHQAKYYGCLCEYCENIELKLKVLAPRTSNKECCTNLYKFINSTLCPKPEGAEFHKKTCINRMCGDCGVDRLDQLCDTDCNDQIEWQRWEMVESTFQKRKTKTTSTIKKRSIVKKAGTIDEFIKELKIEASPHALHMFQKDWQQKQYKDLKNKLEVGSVISIMDFSENYKCSYQREVQSAYYSQDSSTLHPIVNYYNCPECHKLVQESCIMISNDLVHDHHLVHVFQTANTNHLRNTRKLDINTMYRFSDGCSSQYKSKGPISDISYAVEDFGHKISHNYYGTRHGKGASDGEGAVIKSQASRAVLSGTAIIANPKGLYEFAKTQLTKDPQPSHCCEAFLRTIFYTPMEEVNRDRHRCGNTVKGTMKLHSVRTVACGIVETRNLTCVCDPCLQGEGECINAQYVESWKMVDLGLNIGKPNEPIVEDDNESLRENDTADQHANTAHNHHLEDTNEDEPEEEVNQQDDDTLNQSDTTGHTNTRLTNGSYVAVRFESRQKNILYMAMVADTSEVGITLAFMKRNNDGYYSFTDEKQHIHPLHDIAASVASPLMTTVKRAFVYQFNDEEIHKIAVKEHAVLK